jgi:tetratricopeptide (TPR) repeat protein
MNALTCEKCGTPLGLAEASCSQCGAPVSANQSALALALRANRAFEAERIEEAVDMLKRALDMGLPEADLGAQWRKLGLWMEKLGTLEEAGKAFRKALEISDSDEVAHQLYIANYVKRGAGVEVTAYYQGRLDKNPEDVIAKKFLGVIKLSADFLTAPPPTLNLPPPSGAEKWLKPKPWKLTLASLTLVFALAMVLKSSLFPAPVEAPQPMTGGMDPLNIYSGMAGIFNDPWVWGFQAGLSALALYYMFTLRER